MNNTSRIDMGGITFFCIPKVAGSSIKAALLRWKGYNISAWKEVHGHSALKGSGGFVCAVVRHPMDRLVSSWANKSKAVTPRLRRLGVEEGISFGEWLDLVENDPYADHHYRPQSWFIEEKPDFIWRYDELSLGWRRLQDKFGVPSLQTINPSERGVWTKYFTKDQYLRVVSVYREDMELYLSTLSLHHGIHSKATDW